MEPNLEFEKMLDIIVENVNAKIPDRIKTAIGSMTIRKNMLQKYGKHAFLDPERLKFPVVDPKTGKLNCALVYAAYMRSNWQSIKGNSKTQPVSYYNKIKEEAKQLFNDTECDSKLNIHLSKEDKCEIGMLDFSELFELNMETENKSFDLLNYE